MLPSLNKKIRIGIGTAYAAMAAVHSKNLYGWRYADISSSQDQSWAPALSMISDWLTEVPQNSFTINICLSSKLAPIVLLPWHDQLVTSEQQALLAKAHLKSIYGEVAEAWEVVVDSTGYGRPWLASAVDADLASALRALNASRLVIQPLAASILNRFLSRLKHRTCWLLVPEVDATSGFFIKGGQLTLFKLFNELNKNPLRDILTRELRLGGLPEEDFEIVSLSNKIKGLDLLESGWVGELDVQSAPLHLLGVMS